MERKTCYICSNVITQAHLRVRTLGLYSFHHWNAITNRRVTFSRCAGWGSPFGVIGRMVLAQNYRHAFSMQGRPIIQMCRLLRGG